MQDTRAVAEKFMSHLCAQRFEAAFDLLADDATYQIIGTTAVSTPMTGRDTVKATLVPALASFQEPPKLTLKHIIVDGNHAVGLAAGHGVGPTGLPYNQPHYAMVMRVENGRLQEVTEFADTVAVEVALLGKKLVDA